MPTLYLLRHAKAQKPVKHAWDPADDRNRQLSASGMADARAVGTWFATRGVIPGVAIVSPAVRAQQTWELASAELGSVLPIRVDPALYEATVTDLLRTIRGIPAEFTSAIIVGHNPALSDLIGVELPTCALARLDLTSWGAATSEPDAVKVRRIRATDDD